MPLLNVSRIVNANIYIDGASMLGRADEVELAFPKAKMVDHKGLGMIGTLELPAGIDKLEAKIKWASVYDEVLKTISIFQTHSFQIRADRQEFTPLGLTGSTGFTGIMSAAFKDGGPLNFKQHEQVDFPTTLAVYHVEYYLAGVPYLVYDAMANIYIVQGVDQLINFKAHIGVI